MPCQPLERGAHGQVEILAERIVRPAAGVLDGRAPPDAAGAVELEQPAGERARALLDHEMPVLHEALRAREPVLLVIGEFAARLHEAGARVVDEQRHGALQPIRPADGSRRRAWR